MRERFVLFHERTPRDYSLFCFKMLKPSLQIHDVGGVMVAEFWDCLRLDPAPVRELKQQFENHLHKNGNVDLVIDLSGVGFAGSASLGGFLGLRKLAQTKAGRIVFCNVEPNVFEVFRVSKLEPLFLFALNRDAALKRLAEPASEAGATQRPSPASGTPGVLRRPKSS